MKLLYITFIDFGELSSGSSVRPQKLYDAFLEAGVEVTLVSGLQNRRAERRRTVQDIINRLDEISPDICYVEPPSGPFFNVIDLKLLKEVHKRGVPIGLFYRDAYWKFADWWGVKGIKKWVLTYLHMRDLKVFANTCDIMYFPSLSMANLFSFADKRILPPACDVRSPSVRPLGNPPRAIYVGGMSQSYGGDILLSCFDKLNQTPGGPQLTVVCRKGENDALLARYQHAPWLSLRHASGEQLATEYEQCDFAVLPRKRDFYMDFAVPVKLMEYLSFSKPVVATDCAEVAQFIQTYGVGIVTRDDADSLAQGVQTLISDPERFEQYRTQVAQAVQGENLWSHRANQVIQELGGSVNQK